MIVTADNFSTVAAYLDDNGFDIVIFGLTDRGYESLSMNTSDIMQLIQQQQAIINAYRSYYEDVNTRIDSVNESIEADREAITTTQDDLKWWQKLFKKQ